MARRRISATGCASTIRVRFASLREAAREAVRDQIIEFRTRFFREWPYRHCPATQESLTPETADVDHRSPKTFDAIIRGFLQESGMDVESVPLTDGRADNAVTTYFSDPAVEDAFQRYHRAHADLQMVSRSANRGYLRRKV
jgi:hypothetical protein